DKVRKLLFIKVYKSPINRFFFHTKDVEQCSHTFMAHTTLLGIVFTTSPYFNFLTMSRTPRSYIFHFLGTTHILPVLPGKGYPGKLYHIGQFWISPILID